MFWLEDGYNTLFMTSDVTILDMVSEMSLDLTDFLRHDRLPHEIKMSKDETVAEQHIQTFLQKGAIKPCKYGGSGFVSNIFLRPKPDGSFCMILNFKKFNKFIEYNIHTFNNFQPSYTHGWYTTRSLGR